MVYSLFFEIGKGQTKENGREGESKNSSMKEEEEDDRKKIPIKFQRKSTDKE